jgi:hypothetical protein
MLFIIQSYNTVMIPDRPQHIYSDLFTLVLILLMYYDFFFGLREIP